MAIKKTKNKSTKKTSKNDKTTKKPSKIDRNKRIKKNQKIEGERKKVAKYRAERQKLFREKQANSNITITLDQIERQKKQNKLAKVRNKARINATICITEKNSDYGKYFWIDSIPLCDMTQLLTQFKTTEF